MKSLAEYTATQAKWITIIGSEYYPDYLEEATLFYKKHLAEFGKLLDAADSSEGLLLSITEVSNPARTQLLRIFRKYVSPDTSVEMLKRKGRIPDIIRDFGSRFRPIDEVKTLFRSRHHPDEALIAVLYEYKDRGQKGYELTDLFFDWFEEKFGEDYSIQGPRRAGKDVILSTVLKNFRYNIPADFIISRKKDNCPLVIGFARYDSDRGGAQEDDRPGGNRVNMNEILRYSSEAGIPLKVLFLNDGPGLLLGSMWSDYISLEEHGKGKVMVATLKMLDERFTREWLES